MENLREKLNNKVEGEYRFYISLLKQMPTETILSSSYKKNFYEEFVGIIKNADLEPEEVKALLKLDNTLETVYDGWMDTDVSYMEMLEDSFSETLEDITSVYIEQDKIKNRQKDCR